MKRYIAEIKDENGVTIEEVLATTLQYAIDRFKEGAKYNKFYRGASLSAEWKMTSDGANRITTIQMLKKGDYFVTVNKLHKKGTIVYVRDTYDHSSEKYECYKFDDVNKFRYFPREQLVTDEMTF